MTNLEDRKRKSEKYVFRCQKFTKKCWDAILIAGAILMAPTVLRLFQEIFSYGIYIKSATCSPMNTLKSFKSGSKLAKIFNFEGHSFVYAPPRCDSTTPDDEPLWVNGIVTQMDKNDFSRKIISFYPRRNIFLALFDKIFMFWRFLLWQLLCKWWVTTADHSLLLVLYLYNLFLFATVTAGAGPGR